MAHAWIVGVTRVPADRPGVPFTTKSRRALWHTTETAAGTLAGVVKGYERTGSWPHITWDPSTGEIAPHYPATIGSRALKNPPGGAETNSFGALQIEVVGYARKPFTAGPMKGAAKLLAWLRANGVPDVWPAGQPLAYGKDERRPGVTPAAYGVKNGTRTLTAWRKAGHFAHSQVPENDHGDPGRIDIAFTKAKPVPPPLPPQGDDMPAMALFRATEPVHSIVWVVGSSGRWQLDHWAVAAGLHAAGLLAHPKRTVRVAQTVIDAIPLAPKEPAP